MELDALAAAGRVAVLGMALVFVALGLLLLVILALQRVFPPTRASEEPEAPPAAAIAPGDSYPQPQPVQAADRAAAIAVALALAEQGQTARALPAAGPTSSPWSRLGRQRQMNRQQPLR